jgi:FkbM family methyltransferase
MNRQALMKLLGPIKNMQFLMRWRFAAWSYSQEGEDLILRRVFEKRDTGFYVDVGAHHPVRFSNTYWFYRRGWRGINIDATPGSMTLFRKVRPRDINLELAIADGSRNLKLYLFNEPALNTFDASLARERNQGIYRIVGEQEMTSQSLADVFKSHMPEGLAPTFLTIDVEGLDLDVLKSNDWSRFRPEVVLLECLNSGLGELAERAESRFMKEKGYRPFSKTLNTVIYRDESHV